MQAAQPPVEFTVSVSSTDPRAVADPGTADVVIADDDGKIRFEIFRGSFSNWIAASSSESILKINVSVCFIINCNQLYHFELINMIESIYIN